MNFLEHLALLGAGLGGFAIWPNIRGSRSAKTSGAVNGIPCDFKQQRVGRSNKVTVTVAMACDERFEFTLRREGFTDSLAKTFGLVREFQTQDERFDEAVYIGADERGFDEWLAQDADARQAFLDLLGLEAQEYTRVTAITASRGTLRLLALARPPMFSSAPDDLALTVATACAPRLKSCVDRLQAFASTAVYPAAFRDPYAVTVRTLSSLTAGLMLVPLALLLLLQLQTPNVEFATNPFFDRYTGATIVAVVCGLLVVAFPMLWGSARLHTVLVPLLLCGAMGSVIAAPPLIWEVNAEWDQTTPQRYLTQVLRRYVTSGKHTAYYVWLSDWHLESDHQELRVDEATYNDLKEGDPVTVSERAGYLGRRWISDLSRDWAAAGSNR